MNDARRMAMLLDMMRMVVRQPRTPGRVLTIEDRDICARCQSIRYLHEHGVLRPGHPFNEGGRRLREP